MSLLKLYETYKEQEKAVQEVLNWLESTDNSQLSVELDVYVAIDGRNHELPRGLSAILRKRVLSYARSSIPAIISDLQNALEEAEQAFVAEAKLPAEVSAAVADLRVQTDAATKKLTKP